MSYVLLVQSVALLFSWGTLAAHLPPRPSVTLAPVVVLPRPMIVPQTLPPFLPRFYGGGGGTVGPPRGGSFGNPILPGGSFGGGRPHGGSFGNG